MARKVLGYIELIWTCDSCGTRNPGPIKSCTSCGAPQPTDVKFVRVDPETFNFIKDEALIRMAQSGPDKHCPYCGTRNSSDAKICVNCGGDLTLGATSRPAGSSIEAEDAPNQKPASKPLSKGVLIAIILLLVVCCGSAIFFFNRSGQTDEINAQVVDSTWSRTIAIEAYQMVAVSDWEDEIPQAATAYDCELRYHYDSDTPQANSTEVCGEPYTIDTGTGIGEVVQDCYYEVSDYYCSYDTMEWVVVDTLSADGSGTSASWPNANLSSSQRAGTSTEQYIINFRSDDEDFRYTTSDYDLYQQALPGSEWILEVNGLGNIVSIRQD